MRFVKQLSLYIFLGLLAYMPLHIFLSTWIGTSLGILEPAKVTKEVVLLIGFLGALAASLRKPWFAHFLKDKLIWLVVAYAAWTVLLAAVKPIDQDAEILGVVYNTRFLLFFFYGLLLAKVFDTRQLARAAVKVTLGVAVVVLFFGVVQYTVLPDDALERVGYSRASGVLPAFFIDDKPDLERIMSFVRDPNSFGSYVIIIGMLSLAFWLRGNLPRQSALGLLALSGLCLLFSFSRSAWLGFALAAASLCIFHYRGRLIKEFRKYLLVLGLFTLVFMGAVYSLRHTYLVQNIVFHADESTVLEDPNELRLRFWRESIGAITGQPLGHGPGTAGLASIRNDVQGTVLNESYYLQIGHETGFIGLVLFLAILGLVGHRLLVQARSSSLALGLFAAFVGLALTNMLVHIWSNEAVAYTWWGLAGLTYWHYQHQRQRCIIKSCHENQKRVRVSKKTHNHHTADNTARRHNTVSA